MLSQCHVLTALLLLQKPAGQKPHFVTTGIPLANKQHWGKSWFRVVCHGFIFKCLWMPGVYVQESPNVNTICSAYCVDAHMTSCGFVLNVQKWSLVPRKKKRQRLILGISYSCLKASVMHHLNSDPLHVEKFRVCSLVSPFIFVPMLISTYKKWTKSLNMSLSENNYLLWRQCFEGLWTKQYKKQLRTCFQFLNLLLIFSNAKETGSGPVTECERQQPTCSQHCTHLEITVLLN